MPADLSPAPPGYTLTESGLAMPTDLRADALSDLRSPTAWLSAFASGYPVSSGVAVTPQTSMALSAYYDCIRVIAEDCGKLPLQVLEREARGRRKAPEHPLWPILHDEWNEDMTAMTAREVVLHHALGWGNGYALILRERRMGAGDGEVTALYPLHPACVQVARDRRTGEIFYAVTQSTTEYVRQADMLHIKGLGADGLQGYSVWQMAAESLGLSLAAQTFGAAFFSNGAALSGVLEHPGTLTEVARNHMRDEWRALYGGPRNAGAIGILWEGMKYQKLGIPPDEAQYLETRQFQTREVCRWFRVSPTLIGDLTDAHYNNIEQESINHVVNTLMPWLQRIEQELNRKLFRGTNFYAKHDIRGLLRGDQAARAQYYKDLFSVGAYSPNDILELDEMNTYEGGDSHFLQVQYATVESIVDGSARQQLERRRPVSPTEPGSASRNGHSLEPAHAPE